MQRLTRGLLAVAALASVAAAALMPTPDRARAQQATLFKDPNCGCCANYADYLRQNGVEVSVVETDDLEAVNREAGIPDELRSCHVMQIEGYAVSGHVPVETVRRLLAERPDVRGITLPGMPAGSPGMGGAKSEPFTVYSFGDGSPDVYAVE